MITFENFRQVKEMITGLDYNYFNKYYKLIAIDLSKQQALNADPKAVQQINFTGDLNGGQNVNEKTTMFFIIEETKKNYFRFFTRNCENIIILFCFNIMSI